MANDGQVLYEYPFSERIRTLLRLEDLFDKLLYFCEQQHSYCHHTGAADAVRNPRSHFPRGPEVRICCRSSNAIGKTLQALRNNPQVSEAACPRCSARSSTHSST